MKKLAVTVLGAAAVAVTIGAGAAGAVGSAESGAATRHVNCVGSLDDCGYSAAELGGVAVEKVVTLWTESGAGGNGTGVTIWGPTRDSGRVCTETPDDIDQRANFPVGSVLRKNVEAVEDFPGAHCNWQLIDGNGRSTWVENTIWDLRNLGSGWRDRAIAIRFT